MSADYPEIIEIQFHNLCNANCIICPYRNMNYDKKFMTDDLFKKFLNELKTHKLKRLIPYLNNEPFLDESFIKKLKQIRTVCPQTEIEISTNLVFLTEEKMQELLDLNITDLRLSVFGFNKETYKKMMPTSNYNIVFERLHILSTIFKNSNTKISIVMIDTGEIDNEEFEKMNLLANNLGFSFNKWGFLDRAKNVKWKSNNYYNDNVIGCEQNRPIERMHILCDGKVILCCQDWSHECLCGDFNLSSIEEIWKSKEYNNFRKRIYCPTVNAPELCKNCKLALKSKN